MITVEAKRYSQGDPEYSLTYLCSDFPNVQWINNELYTITYVNGAKLQVKCTRKRTTLYSGPIGDHNSLNFDLPVVGRGPDAPKVFHEIESISLSIKEYDLDSN